MGYNCIVVGEVKEPDALPVTVRRSLRDRILNIYSKLRDRYGDLLPEEIVTPSHSSWRFEVGSSDVALTVTVNLYAGLLARHGIHSKMVLGIGVENSTIVPGALDTDQPFTVVAPESISLAAYLALDQIADVAGHLAETWTEAQATAVYLRLLRPDASQKELGVDWSPKPVTQSAVSQFLDAAEWDLLERTLRRSNLLWGDR